MLLHARLRERVQGWGLSTYARWVGRTARLQIEGAEHMAQARATGRSVILAAWHGMTMMLSIYIRTHDDPSQYTVIVPNDTRGATLSVWIKKLGGVAFPVSMDDVTIASGRRLLQLIREMRRGKYLYLNPDGPDGPTHQPKMGVVFVAHKVGALLVPAAAYTKTCYRVRRWDRYTVPLPFSRIVFYLGLPMEVEGNAETARCTIRARLNEAERTAQSLYEAS
jgi:hypothetical protein